MNACTFIVSAFNRPTELKLCLLSLVIQTRTDWNAIVTDNADSSVYRDCNEDAVRWVGDKRISYFYTGEDSRSPYHSAEAGVRVTEGIWLAFPSDDSYFVPEFLQRMLEFAENFDLRYCDILYDRRLVGQRAVLHTEPHSCAIDKTSFLVRREWFDKVGGFGGENRPVPRPADGEFIEKLVVAGARHERVAECLAVHN